MKRLLFVLVGLGLLAWLGVSLLQGEPDAGSSSQTPQEVGEQVEREPIGSRRKAETRPARSARPDEPATSARSERSSPGSSRSGLRVREEVPAISGLEVEILGAADRERLSVPEAYGSGVLIVKVHPDAPAAEAGLRKGDVIVRAMREDVDEPGDLERAVGKRDHALLIAVRDGQLMQLVVQPPFDAERTDAD